MWLALLAANVGTLGFLLLFLSLSRELNEKINMYKEKGLYHIYWTIRQECFPLWDDPNM